MIDDNDMERLETRVQRIEDLEDIRAVMVRYSHAMDNGFDPDAIGSLFTEDATWSISPATPVTGVHIGRAAISEFFASLPDQYRWTMHNMGTELIELADDGLSACGIWYLVDPCTMKRTPTDEEGEAMLIAGIYRNRFVKLDGVWLIEELAAEMFHIAPWAEGWVRTS